MKIETLEVAGFLPALKGMRNPKNSWDKGDSYIDFYEIEDSRWSIVETKELLAHEIAGETTIGSADMKLAKTLIKGGKEHAKFLRQIMVWADIDMPRYWWSEADTYKIGTVANSCSTMHKLMDTPISFSLFENCFEDADVMYLVLDRLEDIRKQYQEAKMLKNQPYMDRLLLRAKRLLPEGFLQLRTFSTNYQELMTMYHQRKHHRLKEEWVDTFCSWAESLPYFKELCIDTVE